MIVQTGTQRYNVRREDKVTHETYARYYTLAKLEIKLQQARYELEAPEEHSSRERRRQREKVWRLQLQVDNLRLLIESKA